VEIEVDSDRLIIRAVTRLRLGWDEIFAAMAERQDDVLLNHINTTDCSNNSSVMNAATFSQSTDIDYFITNVSSSIVTSEWIVNTYSQRNWVEVFYREAKGCLGLKEYQVRDKISLVRHFILVFCAYTFILWHQMTGGLRRRWANKTLNTFTEALEAFRTAVSFRFFDWLAIHRDVFAAYKASLGYIWA
jgi:hypothetical protein